MAKKCNKLKKKQDGKKTEKRCACLQSVIQFNKSLFIQENINNSACISKSVESTHNKPIISLTILVSPNKQRVMTHCHGSESCSWEENQVFNGTEVMWKTVFFSSNTPAFLETHWSCRSHQRGGPAFLHRICGLCVSAEERRAHRQRAVKTTWFMQLLLLH